MQLLETYYAESRTIRRFRSCGMLAPFIDDFAGYLEEKGFSRSTARSYLRAARHLSLFALHEGKTSIDEMAPELVGRFVNEHLPTCTCERMNGGVFSETVAALSYLVAFLAARGHADLVQAAPPTPPFPLCLPCFDAGVSGRFEAAVHVRRRPAQERRQAELMSLPTPMGDLLVRYDEYLVRLFGLSDKTRQVHRAKMLFFVQWVIETKGAYFPLSELTTSEIVEFQNVCNDAGFTYDYRRSMMSCLRGFLRFLRWEGIVEEDLTVAVYPLIRWKKDSVPRFIPKESVEALLRAVDRASFLGARDYLMLLLLVQLGLRACEILRIHLEDLNLRKGELFIRASKNNCERLLPLSEEIADSVVAYLRFRPPTAAGESRLFIAAKAPYSPLTSSSAVARVVEKYIRITGIDAPFKGSHLLRHSLATHLVNHDVTVKETADILGHRDLDTTSIYAKVDMIHLREIALPLPSTWRKVGV